MTAVESAVTHDALAWVLPTIGATENCGLAAQPFVACPPPMVRSLLKPIMLIATTPQPRPDTTVSLAQAAPEVAPTKATPEAAPDAAPEAVVPSTTTAPGCCTGGRRVAFRLAGRRRAAARREREDDRLCQVLRDALREHWETRKQSLEEACGQMQTIRQSLEEVCDQMDTIRQSLEEVCGQMETIRQSLEEVRHFGDNFRAAIAKSEANLMRAWKGATVGVDWLPECCVIVATKRRSETPLPSTTMSSMSS